MHNIKLNTLIKSKNNLKLNIKEKNELKKNIAMELLISPLFLIETYENNQYKGFVCADEKVLLFTDEQYLNAYLEENSINDFEISIKSSFIQIFIEYNKLSSTNFSILLNKGSDAEYLLTAPELTFLESVAFSEEYNHYMKANSIEYMKNAIKNQKNSHLLNSILVSDSFDNEIISALASSELLLPVFSSKGTENEEKDGVIDIGMDKSLNLAILKIENKEFLMAFTDKKELKSNDILFLSTVEFINKDYYVQVRSFLNIIDLILEKNLDGLIINVNSDKSLIVETSTLNEHYDDLITNLNPKLLNCSFFALNHLYL